METRNNKFGDHKLRSYIHNMKNKLIILTVITGLLFIAMAYYQSWVGLLCMGGAFVCVLMAIEHERNK